MFSYNTSPNFSAYTSYSHRTLFWLACLLIVSSSPRNSVLSDSYDLLNRSFLVWIPFLEVGWTVFTFSLAGAQTYHQMLALRFVVGLFEAGYWPALYYILGSWYNKRESLHSPIRNLEQLLLLIHYRWTWKAQRYPSILRLNRTHL
jgi:MFS family permease